MKITRDECIEVLQFAGIVWAIGLGTAVVVGFFARYSLLESIEAGLVLDVFIMLLGAASLAILSADYPAEIVNKGRPTKYDCLNQWSV